MRGRGCKLGSPKPGPDVQSSRAAAAPKLRSSEEAELGAGIRAGSPESPTLTTSITGAPKWTPTYHDPSYRDSQKGPIWPLAARESMKERGLAAGPMGSHS